MDSALADLDRLRIEGRSHRTSTPASNELSAESASCEDKRGSDADVIGPPLIPTDHLPFHGNPLDRSGTEEWVLGRFPAALKEDPLTRFLPVSERSVFVVKQMDRRSNLETFSLFWLSADVFKKNKNCLFPDSTTHLLGKAGEAGWRFVLNLYTDAPNALLQLRKLQPQLCAADLRELSLAAGQEELAIAGQAVAVASWHQVNRFCPQCGSPSVPAALGTVRRCTMHAEHTKLRPNVSAVVVALVQSPDGRRVLLVRTRSMRPHMVNCVSTRMDVCEGVAEAVQRVLWSLLRLEVKDVHVQGTQPWAAGLAPASELLLGAVVTAKSTEISHESKEVEEAHWFSKKALQALLKGSAVPGHPIQTGLLDAEAKFFLPPPVTISHALLKYWLELREQSPAHV